MNFQIKNIGLVICAILLFTFSVDVSGQLFLENRQYLDDYSIQNPAYAGVKDQHQLMLSVIDRYAGVANGPATIALNYAGRVSDNVGLGATLYNESFGAQRYFRAGGNYSYHMFTDRFSLSLGIGANYGKYNIDTEVLSNPLVFEGDEVLNRSIAGEEQFTASLGLHTEMNSGVYYGFSLPNLVDVYLGDEDVLPEDQERSGFSFLGYIGYEMEMANKGVKIVPSIYFHQLYDYPFQLDVNFLTKFLDETLYAGLLYRALGRDHLGVILGTQLDKFGLFYSYDFLLKDFQDYNNGSHEFTLRVRL